MEALEAEQAMGQAVQEIIVDERETVSLLARLIDGYVHWAGEWHLCLIHGQDPSVLPIAGTVNELFERWRLALARADLAAQPAVERALALHGELTRRAVDIETLAREGAEVGYEVHAALVRTFGEMMDQLRRVERAFSFAASGIDTLTGLRTRQGMADELTKELERLRRGGEAFCLAIADLDRFKGINDTYGHEVGDRALEQAAARIGQSVRGFDDAYRMGGEEFLICLKRTGLAEAMVVLDRVREELAARPLPIGSGRDPLPVTCSFGVVEASAQSDIDDLMVAADQALYRAKHNGRNRVEAYRAEAYRAEAYRGDGA